MLFLLPNIPDLRLGVSEFGLLASDVEAPGLVGKLAKYDVGLPGECVEDGVCTVADIGEAAPEEPARRPFRSTLLTYLRMI